MIYHDHENRERTLCHVSKSKGNGDFWAKSLCIWMSLVNKLHHYKADYSLTYSR